MARLNRKVASLKHSKKLLENALIIARKAAMSNAVKKMEEETQAMEIDNANKQDPKPEKEKKD